MQDRPTKRQYYLELAHVVAKRGTCLRRNYGAIIVAYDQIVATGYTGTPRGVTNCTTCLNAFLLLLNNIRQCSRYGSYASTYTRHQQ